MVELTKVSGQQATFSDGTDLYVPYRLTLSDNGADFSLRVDTTGKTLWLQRPVTRSRLVTAINTLQIAAWLASGKTFSKPEMMQ